MLPATRVTRPAALAAVAALTCGLVACGLDDAASPDGASTVAGAPGVTTAAAATSQKAREKAATGQYPEHDSGANPLNGPSGFDATLAPLEGGTPASDADREEMQRTAHASMNPGSYDKWTRALMDNSCRRVTEPIEAEMARMGMTIDQVEQAARMQQQAGAIDLPPTEVSLDDVRIDGNRASASVTATNTNGTETRTEIFEREDGRWKLCN